MTVASTCWPGSKLSGTAKPPSIISAKLFSVSDITQFLNGFNMLRLVATVILRRNAEENGDLHNERRPARQLYGSKWLLLDYLGPGGGSEFEASKLNRLIQFNIREGKVCYATVMVGDPHFTYHEFFIEPDIDVVDL